MWDFFDTIFWFLVVVWWYIWSFVYMILIIIWAQIVDAYLYWVKNKYTIWVFIWIVLNLIFQFIDFSDVKEIEWIIYILSLWLWYCFDTILELSYQLEKVIEKTKHIEKIEMEW